MAQQQDTKTIRVGSNGTMSLWDEGDTCCVVAYPSQRKAYYRVFCTCLRGCTHTREMCNFRVEKEDVPALMSQMWTDHKH